MEKDIFGFADAISIDQLTDEQIKTLEEIFEDYKWTIFIKLFSSAVMRCYGFLLQLELLDFIYSWKANKKFERGRACRYLRLWLRSHEIFPDLRRVGLTFWILYASIILYN